jgi:hypothetical protein
MPSPPSPLDTRDNSSRGFVCAHAPDLTYEEAAQDIAVCVITGTNFIRAPDRQQAPPEWAGLDRKE